MWNSKILSINRINIQNVACKKKRDKSMKYDQIILFVLIFYIQNWNLHVFKSSLLLLIYTYRFG